MINEVNKMRGVDRIRGEPPLDHLSARQSIYQRRPMNCCCICLAGETEGGGEATARVEGSTMGIALRVR